MSFTRTLSTFLCAVALLVGSSASADAAVIRTGLASYPPGGTMEVLGATFQHNEAIQVSILRLNTNQVLATWETHANSSGNFVTDKVLGYYAADGETLRVAALGDQSGLYASTTFMMNIGTALSQLQNGTMTQNPEWANGNINTNNSCYGEGSAVPYRYFITGTSGGEEHFFTINFQWTKGGVHAFDYIVDYDYSEAVGIAAAGGPCGTISTSPPGDCATPSGSFALPDFTDESNWTGTIPPDFYDSVASPPPFVQDGPNNLRFYNATVDSVGPYYFTGTASNRELNFVVYFTVTSTGSVGFFWGGHLSTSSSDTWGAGNGSASVSGAPYHMSAMDFDNDGGKNQARSIQNGSICLPPTVDIMCDDDQLDCTDLSSFCSDTSGAADYTWTIYGATIDSGATSSTVYYTATDDTVLIILSACNEATGCEGDFCCHSDTALVVVEPNVPPVATCPGTQNKLVCNLNPICIHGFSCTDADGNLVSCSASPGSKAGDSVCFTPVDGVNIITLIATDACGAADTCTTTVNVDLNDPPVATCPGSRDTSVCSLAQICISGFSSSDPNGNLTSTVVTGGTLSSGSVCFTPVVGPNLIRLIATDACGKKDTCETVITVHLNTKPVAHCPGNDSLLVCDLSPLCVQGFYCTDVDDNLVSCSVNNGTLDGDSVCFTPHVGTNMIILVAEDECGQLGLDTCIYTVFVDVNAPPVVNCPPSRDTFVCSLSTICIDGFTASDPNDNIVSTGITGQTLEGDSVCFTPVLGPNVLQFIARDACDKADTCETVINVALNSPPVATCPGNVNKFVCNLNPICVKGFNCSDPDNNLVSCSVNTGSKDGDSVCFTPVVGPNVIRLIATDACGAADTCFTTVNVTLNSPPVATCPGNTNAFVCSLGSPICVPGFFCSDPDNNMVSCSVNTGTKSNDTVCFVPVLGPNVIRLITVDACGLADTCFTTVTVALNAPPVATCPGNRDTFLCSLGPVCINGFECSDPDNNLASCNVTGGVRNGDQVCFNPVVGPNVIRLIAIDACGKADTCQTTITVSLNQPPSASCPPDRDTFVCQLSPICIDGFECDDPDGNLASCQAVGGTLNAGEVCINPVAGPNLIRLIATDQCGRADTCMTFINVALNTPPQVSCPPSIDVPCAVGDTVCVGPFTCNDAEGNVQESHISFGTIHGDSVCFVADTAGMYTIALTCTDVCGATSSCTTKVNITQPSIVIDTISTLPGTSVEVCVKVNGLSFPWGGFDFLLNYDHTVLTLQEVIPGDFLIDCGWEYFTYRIVSSNPGLVRIVSIADMNNSNHHPSCNIPDDGDVIFCLRFKVTNDWTIACQSSPILFWWYDCGDNSISDPTGNILYIAGGAPGTIFGPGDVDITGQPNVGGPPLPCPSDKFEPLTCLEFKGGKVRVICPDEIDDRGDINLNAVAYEIADAVLYSQYFISGPSVFIINFAGQTAASDVNADGVPLTVADLVYLIRVITGDAQPIADDLLSPKSTPHAGRLEVSTHHDGDVWRIESQSESEVGAALFVLNTGGLEVKDVTLSERASSMDVQFKSTEGQLRVLVYNIEDRASIAAGKGDLFTVTVSGEGTLTLASVEAATFSGAVLDPVFESKVLPKAFALYPNSPNPFNPTTTLAADFPVASEYHLKIYNITGQVVRTFDGQAQAGQLTITWDGRNGQGKQVASGVYFYSLSAGDFHAMRKMVLMK